MVVMVLAIRARDPEFDCNCVTVTVHLATGQPIELRRISNLSQESKTEATCFPSKTRLERAGIMTTDYI